MALYIVGNGVSSDLENLMLTENPQWEKRTSLKAQSRKFLQGEV